MRRFGRWLVITVSCLFLLVPPQMPAVGETAVTWDTNADFAQGTLQNLSVSGSGSGATLTMGMVDAWTGLNFSFQPAARQGGALAFASQGFVAFGGKNGNIFFNDTWVFADGKWIKKEGINAPQPRGFSCMAYCPLNGMVYLFGGRNDTAVFNDLWAYNLTADIWVKISASPSPPQRYAGTLTYHQGSGKLLLFGGNNSTAPLNDLWEFTPSTSTWQNRNPSNPPSPRFLHGIASAETNSRLYLYGGMGVTGALSDFYEYNYSANRWSLLTSSPPARYGHAVAYLQGVLVVAGGMNGPSVFGDTWKYNLTTGSWQAVPSASMFPVAMGGYAAAPTQILIAGGFNGGEHAINQFFPSYTGGTFTTQSVDTQRQGTTGFYVRWNPPTQAHGVIRCQVALNNDNLTWNFVGPDGTANTFYDNGYGQPVSGTARYLRVRAYFIPENGIFSPVLDSLSISFNRPPDKPVANAPAGIISNSPITFSWQFADADVDQQTAFRVQVSPNPGFSPITLDSGVIQSTVQGWVNSGLSDGTYYWRVACRDSEGLWSAYSDALQFTLDTVPPSGAITINGGGQYTNSLGVTLSLTYADTGTGVSGMCFSNDGTSWSPWEMPAVQKSWTIDGGDGTKSVYMKLMDAAGNSFVCSDTIVLDTVPPMGSLTINNNADYTNTENVWLQVSATDATSGIDGVRFSNDGTTWSGWQPVTQNMAWTLGGGDGLKQVYAQVRDRSGLTAACSDTIYLDKSPPPAPSFYPEPLYTSGYANTVSWYPVSDALSGGVAYNVECSSTPAFSWVASSGWIYSTTYTFTGLSEGYTYYYRVRSRDALGNTGPYSATVNSTQDASGPVITQTSPSPPAYFNSPNIVLSWKAVDYISGLSGRYHIQISTDENFVISTVDTYITGSTGNTDTIYHAPSLPDGKYYWRVRGEDCAGNWGQFSQVRSFEVDSDVPRIVCNKYVYGWYSASPGSVIDVDFYADGSAPLSNAKWRKPNGDWHYVFQGAFSEYTQNWAVNWDEMEEGSNQIFIEVQDAAGNRENAVVYFLRDTGAPDARAEVSGIEGLNGWYTSIVTVEISGNDSTSGLSKIMYRFFDGAIWTPEQEYAAPLEFNRSGIYTVEYYGIDNAGNFGGRYAVEIMLDLEVPATMCDAGSGWYSELPVVVNLTGWDRHSGVSGIYYSLDGASYTFVNGTAATLEIEAEGIHKLAFFAVDAAGNLEMEKRIEVKVDATPPATELSWSHDNASATVSLTATDRISGIAQTFFWVFNNSTGTPLLEFSGIYNGSFNISEGIWGVLFYTRDQAGNQEPVQNRSLIFDWHEPSIEIYLNGNATTTNSTHIWIAVNATDNLRISGIAFSNDSYNWTTPEEFCAEKIWVLDGTEGWHTVYCRVVDIAGNANMTKRSIYLDTATPVIYDFGVPPFFAGNSRVLLKWYVSEPVRANISFSPDGENFEVVAENITTTELPWVLPRINSQNCILRLDVWDAANNHAAKYSNFFAIDSLPPDVESFSPEVAEPAAWIEIKFTEDMDKESVERSFVIQPYVSGKFYWVDNRTLIFVPDGKLEEGKTYRIIIRDEAKDLAGNCMSQRIFFTAVKSYMLYYIVALAIIVAAISAGVYLYWRRKKKKRARVF
ncbi:MAG: Ig-like domain-containing protein [Thermoplasmata archaeon]|nr:Ig-like domain-containing protein [Thermoplasmata archaeon]